MWSGSGRTGECALGTGTSPGLPVPDGSRVQEAGALPPAVWGQLPAFSGLWLLTCQMDNQGKRVSEAVMSTHSRDRYFHGLSEFSQNT